MTNVSGRWVRLAALAVLGVAPGCTTSDEPDHAARDAAIYQSVIIDLVDRSGVELAGGGEELPVLFIEALGPDGIPLAVQVEVVGGLIEQYEIRFIDDLEEAVDGELPGLPVRDGSLLLGLGDVDVDGTAEVHSEVYLGADDVRGFGYTLAEREDLRWAVVGNPVVVEPDGLMPSS